MDAGMLLAGKSRCAAVIECAHTVLLIEAIIGAGDELHLIHAPYRQYAQIHSNYDANLMR